VKKKWSGFILILLLLGAALSFTLFLWPSPKKPVPQNKVLATNPKVQELVNKHLWLTSQAQEMQQKKRELENSYNQLRIGESIWPVARNNTKNFGIDHSADRNENTAYEDLNRYPKNYELSNPEQVIQGQIADENLQAAYAERYRAEYAKQFVENARRHGYMVELDANYVVVRVTPLGNRDERTPSTVSIPSGPQAQ
jgi:hypothetical protein